MVDLKAKFKEAISKQHENLDSDDVTTLIHRTPWVRILLDRDNEEKSACSIEVEISLPDTVGTDESDSSEIIDRLSKHLQYLQQLRELGFKLSIIGTGCIYCASKRLQETPDDNIFTALLPP